MHEADFSQVVFSDPAQASAVIHWCRAAAGPPAPPDGRDWLTPGWWTSATDWIARRVDAVGLGAPRAVEQIRSWEFSCVLRIETAQGTLYCKALPDSYTTEPQLVQCLAQWHSAFVPDVVAANRHWLLMRACRGHSLDSGAPLATWERVARAYAALQIESTLNLPKLRALGCRERGPLDLRSMVGSLVDDHAAHLQGTEHGLTTTETSRLQQLQPRIELACDELVSSGLPLALEHGDLWDSNVFVADDRVEFIDWTDACLAHPFFSLMPLLVSAAWDPTLSRVPEAQQRIADAYLSKWTAYAAPERLRRTRAVARPLAAIHIAVTYWRDIPRLHSQWSMERMVPFFLRLALAEWDQL
jgi:Phosphotransferase enzyme family